MITSFIVKMLVAAVAAISSFLVATFTKKGLKKGSEREFEIRESSRGKIIGNFRADVSNRSEFEAKATEAIQHAKEKAAPTSSKTNSQPN